jgi:spore maturation protein CgeB
MKILFASYLDNLSASGRQRCDALRELGHELATFHFDGFDRQTRVGRRWQALHHQSAFRAEDRRELGLRFLARVQTTRPTIAWIEKPLMLDAEWLAEARLVSPRTRFVCFQDDDPFGSRIRERPLWKQFVEAIPQYDLHFVKKQVNVPEFSARGARRVALFMHGVYTKIFHPRLDVPAWAQQDLTFVGTPLDHRVTYVAHLLRAGLPLTVYGNHWHRTLPYWRSRAHFRPEVVADDYARLLSGSRVCLGFVSSSNRDEYSMRSFEIPGCRSLLLAERTPTHQQLFEEGIEAAFFSSAEECADKARYYLAHEAARAKLARAGYERCVRSDYFLTSRMREAIAQAVSDEV